jgi:hypothetical protein
MSYANKRINLSCCYPIHTKEIKTDLANDMALGLRGVDKCVAIS